MNNKNEKWDLMYELAKNYYEHYGNSDIPNSFKTKNGIDYDEHGFNLGMWLDIQRTNYKNEKELKDAIEESFLEDSNNLSKVNLPNLRKVDNDFLSDNIQLEKLHLPEIDLQQTLAEETEEQQTRRGRR